MYFFWAYLWKSIEFLRVDRLFNEQGAFQVPGSHIFLPEFPCVLFRSAPVLNTVISTFHMLFPSACSTTRPLLGAIIHRSHMAQMVKKYTSLGCHSAASVRCALKRDKLCQSHLLNLRISPLAYTGKYHVEQDPQYALVHLQFVHWADKLLKVIMFMQRSCALFALLSDPVDC